MEWITCLFVYGTLKKGFANDHYLSEAGLLGDYRTMHRFPLVVLPPWHVPCLYERPGHGHVVHGELYIIDDAILRHTDRLEGIHEPNGYYRREIVVERLEGGRERRAWTYFRRGTPPAEGQLEYLGAYRDRRYVAPGDRDASA